jgi:omega-amidase
MKIGLVQYNPVWENKEANREKLLLLFESLTEKVDLVIFPEMTLTGFSMKSNLLAEKSDDESFIFFRKIAKKYSTQVMAGIIEKEGDKTFNSLIHLDKTGTLQKTYRKIHPFTSSGEDLNYARGSQIIITDIDGWKTGLTICYDLRFAELYRFYAKERVALVVNIANWPYARIEHWRTLLKARAIENQCYIVGVNRVGNDPKNSYPGFSSIYGPMGEEVFVLTGEEKIGIAEIHIEKVNEIRKKLPFLDDITMI